MPGVDVKLYVSSLETFRATNGASIWSLRCTATTDKDGKIDFTRISDGDYGGVGCGDHGSMDTVANSDGFSLTPGEPGPGVKNLRAEASAPGKLSGAVEKDSANYYNVVLPLALEDIPTNGGVGGSGHKL
jgi:hypothetical protein